MSNRIKRFLGYCEVYGESGPLFEKSDYIIDPWGRFRQSKVKARVGFYPVFGYYSQDDDVSPIEIRVDFTQYMDFKDMPEPYCRLKSAEEKAKHYYNIDNKANLN